MIALGTVSWLSLWMRFVFKVFAEMRTGIFALLASFRPRHWIKNGIVFAAPFFGWKLNLETLTPAGLTFLAFCAAASCSYLWNDICDVNEDQAHPVKRHRPIASGLLSTRAALSASIALLILALGLGVLVNIEVLAVISLYLGMQLAYSNGLKRVSVLEVLMLAAGFVLRAVAGAEALEIPLSEWFSASIAFLALFLGLGKRRSELARVRDTGVVTRRVLGGYSERMLRKLQGFAGAATVCVYSLWALEGSVSSWILVTAPMVAAGILRVLFNSGAAGRKETPELLLFTDPILFLIVSGWILSCYWILSRAIEGAY